MLSRTWDATKGKIAFLAVSAFIAASTGGVSLTAQAAVEAGNQVAVSGTDMLMGVGQAAQHNLSGVLSGMNEVMDFFAPANE